MPSISEQIDAYKAAIALKKIIIIRYDDTYGDRRVEPHLLGVTTTNSTMLVAYQEFGSSESGERRGWKQFDLTKIRSYEILDDTFAFPRRDYNRNDSRMVRILARI